MQNISVESLYIYPIKSCQGIHLNSMQIGARGPAYDRQWMLIDDQNQFLTQRSHPMMSQIKVNLLDGSLEVAYAQSNALQIPFLSEEQKKQSSIIQVTIWQDKCEAYTFSTDVDEWFSSVLRVKCRLVQISDSFSRQVDQRYANPKDQTGFADGFPELLISTASLDLLNEKLQQKVLMNRFRPNIVISGGNAHQEDFWQKIRIGKIEFDLVKPCARCSITTVNQETGATLSKEPLKTLAGYRVQNGKVMFGQNMIHQMEGEIFVGDSVEVLSFK